MNEFVSATQVSIAPVHANTTNSTTSVKTSGSLQPQNVIELYEAFQYLNFPVQALEAVSAQPFYTTYIFLVCLFYLMLALIYGFSESIYVAYKSEDLKDGTKFLIKLLSLVMAAFLFVLQIPMFTTLLQGY